MEVIKLRAHQVIPTRNRLKEGNEPEDVIDFEGYEVALNTQEVLNGVKNNPDLLIEITDQTSYICSPRCKIRPILWHHCQGDASNKYESEEASKLGLKIGDKIPARELFKI